MKTYLFFYIVIGYFFYSLDALAQESFKKAYFTPNSIGKVKLMKDTLMYFNDLSEMEKAKLLERYKPGSTIHIKKEWKLGESIVENTQSLVVSQAFLDSLKTEVQRPANYKPWTKAYVKFDDDKVLINPLLIKVKDSIIRRPLSSYTLKDRQTIRLPFIEATVNTLTIPLKYRFRNEDEGRSEEFGSSVNLNLAFGLSVGKTSFHHRKKVGNVSNTWKLTASVLAGASTVTLNANNTSLDSTPLVGDQQLTKGLGSLAGGISYSFNKINLGAFYGWDYSIGDDAKKWNYNKKPWLGLAIGYSLFNF